MKGKKTGGRVKGVPNRITATAKENFIDAFDHLGGIQALVEWAKKSDENRRAFYGFYARLIPQDVTSGDQPLAPTVIERVVTTK